MRPAGLFGLSEHLERLSMDGDPLEVLEATVAFEDFRPWLVAGLGDGDGLKGRRPPFEPVSMFKGLILQARHNRSDARMEFMPVGQRIRDRLSWMRFLRLDLGAPLRDVRNRLTETGTLKRVTTLRSGGRAASVDWQLQKKGYIPVSPIAGTRLSANGQRFLQPDRRCLIGEAPAHKPHPSQEAGRQADAPAYGARQCEEIRHPRRRRARLRPSEDPLRGGVRTIGLARAEAKLTLANIAYNVDRLIFHKRRGTVG
ncbi:MAG: transposase [Pseudomonadota bacterium]